MQDILFSFGLIILAGVVFKRFRIGGVDADTLRLSINATVLNVFLPALCIKTIYESHIDPETALVPVTAWITTISALLISIVVYTVLERIMNLRPQEKGVLILSSAFGNVTYLGLPVLVGLYGREAAKYALFYDLLATTPILWLVGAYIASRYGEGKRPRIVDSLKIIVSLPPIWGIAGGMLLRLTNIEIPAFVLKTLEMFSSLVIPLMIFSIGLALSLPRVKHAYIIIPAVIIKLAVVPVISFTAAFFLGIKGTALSACFIEGAMPTMVLSLLIAAKFRLDVPLSAFMIITTTVLSFITLPFAIYLTELMVH